MQEGLFDGHPAEVPGLLGGELLVGHQVVDLLVQFVLGAGAVDVAGGFQGRHPVQVLTSGQVLHDLVVGLAAGEMDRLGGIQRVGDQIGLFAEVIRAELDEGGGEETSADIARLLAEQLLVVHELVAAACADRQASLLPDSLGVFVFRADRHAFQRQLLEGLARDDIQVPDALRQAEGMDHLHALRAVALVVEIDELDALGIGLGGAYEHAEVGEVLAIAGGLLQQLDGDFDVARALVHRDDHVGERRQRHGEIQPELRRADGRRRPLDVRVVAQGRGAVQEIALERIDGRIIHLERIVDGLHVLADERAELVQVAQGLLARLAEADEDGRMALGHIAQRLALAVLRDVREVDRVQLGLVLAQLVEAHLGQVEHAHAVTHRGDEGGVAVDAVTVAQDLRLDGRIRGQVFQEGDVLLLVGGQEVERAVGAVEPGSQPVQADGLAQGHLVLSFGPTTLEQDETVAVQLLLQGLLALRTEDVGDELADGQLLMVLAVTGELHQDDVSLAAVVPVFLPFLQDGLGESLGVVVQAQEDVVLATLFHATGVGIQPGAVPQAARHDQQDHAGGEGEHQHEDREVGEHQTRLMEDDRRDDVVEDNRMADEHLQARHHGNQHELDPVTGCDRVGGQGEKVHMDGRAGDQKEAEDGDDRFAVSLPVEPDEGQDEAGRQGQQ